MTGSTGLTRNRTPALVFFVGVVTLTLPPLSDQQTALQAAPHQVLYLTQSAGFAHAVLGHSEAVLGRIGADSGAFDVTVSHDASTVTADMLDRYDAVVFYTTGELPMRDDQKAALLAYVRGGGGFVGVHIGVATQKGHGRQFGAVDFFFVHCKDLQHVQAAVDIDAAAGKIIVFDNKFDPKPDVVRLADTAEGNCFG